MKRSRAILIFLSASLFCAFVAAIWRFTVDDAFITLRYSRNLAAGYGPTWNAGQPPIEGYTSFLWMLLLAGPHALRVDSVLVSKVLGTFLALLSFPAVYLLAKELGATRSGPAVSVLLFAALPFTALHSVSGMETCLAALLATSFALLILLSRRLPWTIPVLPLIGLAWGLTRPEANLTIAVALLFVILREKKRRSTVLISILALYLLPGAVYFAWRWHYYAVLLPLSFYVKTQGGLVPGLPTVAGLVGSFIIAAAFPLLAAYRNRHERLAMVTAMVGLQLLVVVPIEPIMGYAWRFVFPAVPTLCAIVGYGHSLVAARGSRLQIWALTCWMLACLFVTNRSEYMQRFLYGTRLQNAHIRLGEQLARAGMGTVAVHDAGAIPYYSKWLAIDTFGLNDAEIALTGKHDPAYILSKKPDVIVLISHDREHLDPPSAAGYGTDLYAAAIGAGMAHVETLEFNEGYFLWVLATAHATSLLSPIPFPP